jgi:uncharacterized protein (TIGR00661 family)
MKKLLYGISGIGTGHTYRQLPLLQHFAKKHRIVMFTYGESYRFYSKYFRHSKNVSVLKVAIPFIAGNKNGLDFNATMKAKQNKNKDFLTVNWKALAKAGRLIGRPDLVITDYEPLSAQYAYAYDAPLVTIDQQSKYLFGKFPETLSGQGFKDEIMRLSMFFPKAEARIACSFFNVAREQGAKEVLIFPPTLKDRITSLKRRHSSNSILVFISSQREFVQDTRKVFRIFASIRNMQFHVFMRGIKRFSSLPQNVMLYEQGDNRFYKILQECAGIVSTAGHMLLSEAMYLGIPVYAIPLGVYEQHMNAYIIDKHHFGVSCPRIDKSNMSRFIQNIPLFERAIKQDKKVLLRRPGQKEIINYLEKRFL